MNKRTKKNEISRRSFFKKISVVLGAVASFEALGIAFNFLSHSKKKDENVDEFVTVGKVDDFKINSVTPFRNGKFYLSRLEDGGLLAMSLKCTHLGCSIGWNKTEEKFVCPCHSSSFSIKGDVENPPAPRALDLYNIKIEKGIVKVNIHNPIKRGKFLESQVTYVG